MLRDVSTVTPYTRAHTSCCTNIVQNCTEVTATELFWCPSVFWTHSWGFPKGPTRFCAWWGRRGQGSGVRGRGGGGVGVGVTGSISERDVKADFQKKIKNLWRLLWDRKDMGEAVFILPWLQRDCLQQRPWPGPNPPFATAAPVGRGRRLHVSVSIVGKRQRLQPVVHLSSLRPLWFFTADRERKINFQSSPKLSVVQITFVETQLKTKCAWWPQGGGSWDTLTCLLDWTKRVQMFFCHPYSKAN